ncbi:MAG: hypothetical protein AAGK97_18000, partial [Bacteroidota bacterium]
MDRSIWKDWYYDESYAYDYKGGLFSYPLLKDFNTKNDQQSILASRKSFNWTNNAYSTTAIGDPLLLLGFDKVKYQYDFMNPKLLKKYNFNIEGVQEINGTFCYVISFYPKSSNRRFIIDQSRKNKSAIYIGRIYIEESSFAVTRIEYRLAVDRDYGFFANAVPLDYKITLNYQKLNAKWCLKEVHFVEKKSMRPKSNINKPIIYTSHQKLKIYEVDSLNVQSLPNASIFKSTRFSALRGYNKNYNPNYWKSKEVPIDIPKKVKQDLEQTLPLEIQFENYLNELQFSKDPPQLKKQNEALIYHDTILRDSLHWIAYPSNEI